MDKRTNKIGAEYIADNSRESYIEKKIIIINGGVEMWASVIEINKIDCR